MKFEEVFCFFFSISTSKSDTVLFWMHAWSLGKVPDYSNGPEKFCECAVLQITDLSSTNSNKFSTKFPHFWNILVIKCFFNQADDFFCASAALPVMILVWKFRIYVEVPCESPTKTRRAGVWRSVRTMIFLFK